MPPRSSGRQAFDAREQGLRVAELQAMVAALRASLHDMHAPADDLWVKARDGHVRIAISGIDYLRAERDYVRICAGNQSYLIAETMTAMEARLAPMGFLRIHRGILVRRSAVRRIVRRRYGVWAVQLPDGNELGIGRSYAASVLRVLQVKPGP